MGATTEDRIRALEDEGLKTRIYSKFIFSLALACGVSLGYLWKTLSDTNVKIAKAEKQIDLAVSNALDRVHLAVESEAARAISARFSVQRVTVSGRSDTSRLSFFIPTESLEVPIVTPAHIRGYPQVTVVYSRAETLNGTNGIKVQVRFAGPAKDVMSC